MSYGCDQTRVNRQRIIIIVLAVTLVMISIIAGVFIAIRYFNAGESAGYSWKNEAASPTYALDPSETPLPTATMTAFPTYTVVPTTTGTTTLSPTSTNTPQPDIIATPVFLYDVDEVLYLNSSINEGRYWNPSFEVPSVPQPDKGAILDLLWNSHLQREDIFKNEDYSALDTYNAGSALSQIERYYDRYIVTGDDCQWIISIVDGKFNTVITQYDGHIATTMTMKVENRDYLCGGVLKNRIANDGYAYENQVQKFDNGSGGFVWKIIAHPVSVGQ